MLPFQPQQLLESVRDRGAHQIFFLDIEIKNEPQKGLDLALEIRRQDPYANIIFVTTHSEFMPLTFQYMVSALSFIDKTIDDSLFYDKLEAGILYVQKQLGDKIASQDIFYFESNKTQIQVPFNDILYFETSSSFHKVGLRTKKEYIEFYGKVSDIENLDERLFRSHRSIVVNPVNIKKIDKKNLLIFFDNDEYCQLAKRRAEQLLELLHI